VGVLDGQALGAVEIVSRQPFYDFRSKHSAGRSDYHLPARLSPERYRSALRMAVMAHEALGCEGASRVDLIVSDRGNEVVLEVNTLPAMAPTSLLPKIAHAAGMSFDDLVEEILRGARLRAHGHRRDRRGVRLGFEGPERRAGFQFEAH
jgi:D-alanine-D-alanine ligase